jgi:hypothetical protein
MKNRRTIVLCVCITLCSLGSFAQKETIPLNEPDNNKPKLFNSLPDRISVNIATLNTLLTTPPGNKVVINFGNETPFLFEGRVISATSKYKNSIQSVVISSTNYNGARLTFSRTINADKTISSSGRILSFQHGDLLELQQEKSGFVLVKKKFYDLVNE